MGPLSFMLAQSSYRPFLDPLDLHDAWWFTLIPLALFVSVAYKAIRVGEFRGYWKQVVVMASQVVLAMVALGVGLYLVVELVAPRLG